MNLKTILRMVELIICAVLFIFWYALGTYGYWPMITCGAVLGYLIITAILFVLEFTKFDSTPIYIIIGAVLFLLAGILIFIDLPGSETKARTNALIAAILFLANGAIFLVDFIVVLKGGQSSGD
ncbi:uncharacterized protein [Eurosta solidaginis]|uniref:uncharacterized protein n=1 Tax=Eurosta solidaginis TaxID=178769 RepID=UPI0035313DAA